MTDPPVPVVPDRASELTDAALDWINSKFARTVALKLTPLLLPVLGAGAVWLQNVVGINMDPTVAAAFVVSVVVGAGGAVAVFVHNHGKGAMILGQGLLELEKLFEAGRNELEAAENSPPPPPADPASPIGVRSAR